MEWIIVPGEVTQSSVELWLGYYIPVVLPSLFSLKLRLRDADGREFPLVDVPKNNWERPLPKAERHWFQLVTVQGLRPQTSYTVSLGSAGRKGWVGFENAEFMTLPERIPSTFTAPFRIMAGSCFYESGDGGETGASYKALWSSGYRCHAKFLMGDQVYLDNALPLASVPLNADSARELFRDTVLSRYYTNWRELGSVLKRGANYMLPDDHEYHNDYPFEPSVPVLLTNDGYRASWTHTCRNAAQRIQMVKRLRWLRMEDLSFCVADTRTEREQRARFMRDEEMESIVSWLRNAASPSVLVLSQPLFAAPHDGHDHGLAFFGRHYGELVAAIKSSKHDVVVFAGDVHFGRVGVAELGGKRLIEIISSPMSNIRGDISNAGFGPTFASAKPVGEPRRFPASAIDGVPQVDVVYPRMISTLPSDLPAYSQERSREHFVTAEFSRTADGIEMRVDAWQVRSRRNPLPQRDYQYQVTLT